MARRGSDCGSELARLKVDEIELGLGHVDAEVVIVLVRWKHGVLLGRVRPCDASALCYNGSGKCSDLLGHGDGSNFYDDLLGDPGLDERVAVGCAPQLRGTTPNEPLFILPKKPNPIIQELVLRDGSDVNRQRGLADREYRLRHRRSRARDDEFPIVGRTGTHQASPEISCFLATV